MVDEKLLNIYGCPICKGKLDWYRAARKLYCYCCKKIFHITKSDVPILLSNQEEYEKKYSQNYNV